MYYLKHRAPGPLIAGWSTVDLDTEPGKLRERLQRMSLGSGCKAAIFDEYGRTIEGPRVGPTTQEDLP